MNILKFRKLIFTNLFLFNLFHFSNPVFTSSFYRNFFRVDDLNKNHAKLSVLKKTFSDRKIEDNFELTKEIALKGNLNQKFQLEIQSDKQFQRESVLYAEGDVFLVLGDQVFKSREN